LEWLRGREATYTELGFLPSHGENRGLIPLGRASNMNHLASSFFFGGASVRKILGKVVSEQRRYLTPPLWSFGERLYAGDSDH
jgi:hypothetical protein